MAKKQHVNVATKFPVFAISDSGVEVQQRTANSAAAAAAPKQALLNVGGGGAARSGVGNFITGFVLNHNDQDDPCVEQVFAFNTGSRLCTTVDVAPNQELVASSLEEGCLVLRYDKEACALREVGFFATDDPVDDTTPACQNVARFCPTDSALLATGGDDTTASIWTITVEAAAAESQDADGDLATPSPRTPPSTKVEEKGVEVKKDGENLDKASSSSDDDDANTANDVGTEPPTPKPDVVDNDEDQGSSPSVDKETDAAAAAATASEPRYTLKAERKFKLVGHLKPVKDLHFSPSGKLLATASGDKTCRIWNVADGKVLQIVPADQAAGLVFRRCRFLSEDRLLTLQVKPGRGGHSFVVEFMRDPAAPKERQWVLRKSARVFKGLATTMHVRPPMISVADAAGGLTLHDFETLRNLAHLDEVHSLPVTGLSALPNPADATKHYVMTGSMDKTMAMIPAEAARASWALRLLLPLFLVVFVVLVRVALFSESPETHHGEL